MTDELERATALADQLVEIMRAEGRRNFLPGLKEIARIGREGGSDPDQALQEMGRLFRGMRRSPGSFDDEYIDRSDFAERMRMNRELDAIKDRLTNLLPEDPRYVE
jgi:hypothetical protein